MKSKIIVLIVSLLFAFSCKKNEVTTEVKKDLTKTETNSTEHNYVNDYSIFLTTLDVKKIDSASKAFNYFDESSKVDSKLTNECYAKFEEFYKKVLSNVDDEFNSKSEEEKQFLNLLTSKDEDSLKKATKEQKDYIELLTKNGFETSWDKSHAFIQKNEKFFTDKFKNIVSPELKEYLIQKQTEYDEGFMLRMILTITPENLAKRIVFWENFIKKYPDFFKTKEITEANNYNILILLDGLDDSPVFNTETQKLNDEYKKAYLFLIEKYSETSIGKTVKEFYSILEKNDFKANEETKKIVKKYSLK